jgi:hypothetical protein
MCAVKFFILTEPHRGFPRLSDPLRVSPSRSEFEFRIPEPGVRNFGAAATQIGRIRVVGCERCARTRMAPESILRLTGSDITGGTGNRRTASQVGLGRPTRGSSGPDRQPRGR